jgi:GNAT superfamily N-acetyltransferase
MKTLHLYLRTDRVIHARFKVLPPGYVIRPVRLEDRDILAGVLFRAYEGGPAQEEDTIDDAKAEIDRTWDGEYGTLMIDQSVVAINAAGTVIGASLLTLHSIAEIDHKPLLAHVIVEPVGRGLGIGSALIDSSVEALRFGGVGEGGGFGELHLAVGIANTAAARLYLRMGFRLFVEGAPEGWTTDELLFKARDQITSTFGEFVEAKTYGVALFPSGVDAPIVAPKLNVDFRHRVPFACLAAICGYRGDNSDPLVICTLTIHELEAAVALLKPAEVNTNWNHPNLWGWESLIAQYREGDRLVAVFGDEESTVETVTTFLEQARLAG